MPYSLSGMPMVSSRCVGRDVHGFHVGEGGEHHLDLGRLEHAAIFVVVAILHLDIGLREEAENLGEQVALVVEIFCAQSRQSSPSGTSSGIQWICCWRFQKS